MAEGSLENAAFSEALADLAERDGDRLTVEEVVEAFGDKAFTAIMLVIALISSLPLPPGASALTGAPLVLLSLQLALGRERLWLPRRLMEVSAPRAAFRNAFHRCAPAIRFAERLSRPRLSWLTSPAAERVIGVICLLLAIELALPIPGGNMAPSVAIALFSIGLTQRDGIAVLLGGVGTAASVAMLVLMWKLVVALGQGVLNWAGGLF